MDRALLLEEKNIALRKGGLLSGEKKGGHRGEKPHVRNSKGFTRWERGGNKEGSSSKSGEGDGGEKKTGGGKLSQTELRERSRKGLCFKCGETWGKDHVCKLKHYKFVLIAESDKEESDGSDTEEVAETLIAKVMQLSLKSKEGLTSNTSLRSWAPLGA